jgi:hypothetical protein
MSLSSFPTGERQSTSDGYVSVVGTGLEGDDGPSPRARVILGTLRRTVVGGHGIEEVLTRLMNEVRPTKDELVDALVEADALPDSDPAKLRVIALLGRAIDSHLFDEEQRRSWG